MIRHSGVAAAFLALCLTCSPAPVRLAAGDVNHPPGPPGPTMKTLAQVEPRSVIDSLPITITESGSYYLTSNLLGVSGSPGIIVAAENVTIDLSGFTLQGVPGSLAGIVSASSPTSSGGFGGLERSGATGGNRSITILHGTLRDWGKEGARFEDDTSARANGCTFLDNGRDGVFFGAGAIVEDCIARGNNKEGNGAGIHVGSGSVVRGCTTSENSALLQGGACGISTGGGSVIVDNSCFGQRGGGTWGGADGIIVNGNFALIRGNTCHGNFGSGSGYGRGINAPGTDHNVINNVCYGNTGGANSGQSAGIVVGARCRVEGNSCTENSSAGPDGNAFGIVAGESSLVMNNNCARNYATGTGISVGVSVGSRSRVVGNHSSEHGIFSLGQSRGQAPGRGYGIRAKGTFASGVVVIDNTTTSNERAGILFENTVEGTLHYYARNILNEARPVEETIPNVAGEGANANIEF